MLAPVPVPEVAFALARSLARASSNGDSDWEEGGLLVLVGGNDVDAGEEVVVVGVGLEVLTIGDIDVNGLERPTEEAFPDVLRTNTTLPAASNDCLISQEVSRGMYMVGGDGCRIDGDADCVGVDCSGDGVDGDDRAGGTLLCVGLVIGGNCVGGDRFEGGGGGGVTSIDGKLYGTFSGVGLIKLFEFPPVVT